MVGFTAKADHAWKIVMQHGQRVVTAIKHLLKLHSVLIKVEWFDAFLKYLPNLLVFFLNE